jgi:predicted nuclease of predicted toxin-antitoxin system
MGWHRAGDRSLAAVKFLVDMNFSPRWIEILRSSGFEAVHWADIGPRDAPDETILAYARTEGLVVLTHDLDFGLLLAVSLDDGPSVVQLRARRANPDIVATVVLREIQAAASALEAGALLTIEPGRNRVRLLPMHKE